MRPVTWLHISDFHLRDRDSWSQNEVLSRMLHAIRTRCDEGLLVDFVLVTGDLAFCGEESEYKLVAAFFDDLAQALHLSRQLIYCVPGNHDVQRDRQKNAFQGARLTLSSESAVYAFLENTEERTTLLTRQGNYSNFQTEFFRGQERLATEDTLGYVSSLQVDDLHVTIMGLNSSWLAEGGSSDERQLLLGEHQVQNAIDLVQKTDPDIVIGMQHHPFDYLRRFDQSATQHRLESACHFIHSGHLHEPSATGTSSHAGRGLTLYAGASFASRDFRNSFSIVEFDPFHAQASVTFLQYNPNEGAFSYVSARKYAVELDGSTGCTASDLADSIQRYAQNAGEVSSYLGALLLGDMSDVPIPTDDAIAFGTHELLAQHADSALGDATVAFLAVGRAVRLLHGRKSLDEILLEHGQPIVTYCNELARLCSSAPGMSDQLRARNNEAAKLAGGSDGVGFRHSRELMASLLAEGAWDQLRELTERLLDLGDPDAATEAKRFLALCLARSSEDQELERATVLYRELTASTRSQADDWVGLATLLVNVGSLDEAAQAVRQGAAAFPEQRLRFVEVGMRAVTMTGDTVLRDEIRRWQSEEQRD